MKRILHYFSDGRFVIFLALAAFSGTALSATEVPATLIISGTISKGTVAANKNDRINVINAKSGVEEGFGIVEDSSGFYTITLSKTTDFKGTELNFQLVKNGVIYALLDSGKPATVIFNALGFFPAQLSLDMTVGSKIGGSPTNPGNGNAGGGTPAGGNGALPGTGGATVELKFDKKFDINGDNDFTQADIDIIKNSVAHSKGSTAADINKDGRITTLDIILAIKAYTRFIKGR